MIGFKLIGFFNLSIISLGQTCIKLKISLSKFSIIFLDKFEFVSMESVLQLIFKKVYQYLFLVFAIL